MTSLRLRVYAIDQIWVLLHREICQVCVRVFVALFDCRMPCYMISPALWMHVKHSGRIKWSIGTPFNNTSQWTVSREGCASTFVSVRLRAQWLRQCHSYPHTEIECHDAGERVPHSDATGRTVHATARTSSSYIHWQHGHSSALALQLQPPWLIIQEL